MPLGMIMAVRERQAHAEAIRNLGQTSWHMGHASRDGQGDNRGVGERMCANLCDAVGVVALRAAARRPASTLIPHSLNQLQTTTMLGRGQQQPMAPAPGGKHVKRFRDENATRLANSPGSPMPRSPQKERAPTRRRSMNKIVIAPPAEPEPEPEPEPVSNLFKNNPFLMQDRKIKKVKESEAAPEPPKQKIPTVSKAEEAKAKLIELMKRLKAPTPKASTPKAKASSTPMATSTPGEPDEYADYDFDDDLEAVCEADPIESAVALAEAACDAACGAADDAFVLYDWDDYDFDDDVCDEVRIEPKADATADEYADYDFDDDLEAVCENAVAPEAVEAPVATERRSITERILMGNFDLDELAASASQLLPMIELELAIAKAREAEANSEPLIQVLRRQRRAHGRKRRKR